MAFGAALIPANISKWIEISYVCSLRTEKAWGAGKLLKATRSDDSHRATRRDREN